MFRIKCDLPDEEECPKSLWSISHSHTTLRRVWSSSLKTQKALGWTLMFEGGGCEKESWVAIAKWHHPMQLCKKRFKNVMYLSNIYSQGSTLGHIVQPGTRNLRWPFVYLASSRAKKKWWHSSTQSVLGPCADCVQWVLVGATALLLCARLKSRSVWFGSALCLIRLFLGYWLTCSQAKCISLFKNPFRFFPLRSSSRSYLLTRFSQLCIAFFLFFQDSKVHSTCCTFNDNVKPAFLSVRSSSWTSAGFGPTHLSPVCFSDLRPSAKFTDTHTDKSATVPDSFVIYSKRSAGSELHMTWRSRPSIRLPKRQVDGSFKGLDTSCKYARQQTGDQENL